MIAAGVASLVAVGFVLVKSGEGAPLRQVVLTMLAVVSVVLAWAVVHTIYGLRYARLFFSPPIGGIEFPQAEPPDALDFLYVALTIGMTSQVSDTSLAKRAIRRAAIHHALLFLSLRLRHPGDYGQLRHLASASELMPGRPSHHRWRPGHAQDRFSDSGHRRRRHGRARLAADATGGGSPWSPSP